MKNLTPLPPFPTREGGLPKNIEYSFLFFFPLLVGEGKGEVF
jgi:hypothetical protein